MFLFNKKTKKPKIIEPNWSELYTQCINNIFYLESYINTVNANIEYLKSNKNKTELLIKKREWLIKKLSEEKADLLEFKEKLKI